MFVGCWRVLENIRHFIWWFAISLDLLTVLLAVLISVKSFLPLVVLILVLKIAYWLLIWFSKKKKKWFLKSENDGREWYEKTPERVSTCSFYGLGYILSRF